MALFANRDDLFANGGVVHPEISLMRLFHEDAIMHFVMSVCIIGWICLECFLDS